MNASPNSRYSSDDPRTRPPSVSGAAVASRGRVHRTVTLWLPNLHVQCGSREILHRLDKSRSIGLASLGKGRGGGRPNRSELSLATGPGAMMTVGQPLNERLAVGHHKSASLSREIGRVDQSASRSRAKHEHAVQTRSPSALGGFGSQATDAAWTIHGRPEIPGFVTSVRA
jgi:hypothetical protein